MKNFKFTGDVLTVVAPANLVSGQGFLIGSLFLVAQTDAQAGQQLAAVRKGVVELPCPSGDDISAGDKLNWSNANGLQLAAGDLDGVATATADSGTGVALVQAVMTPV